MGTTQRYLMFFSYIGSAFRGSQIQPSNVETVQRAIETGLKNIFQMEDSRPFCLHLGSRTDTGVHALRAALSVDLPMFKGLFLHPEALKFKMNTYFEDFRDIRILEVHVVPCTFKIHQFCLDKTYLYRIGVLKSEFFGEITRVKFIPIVELGRTEFLLKPVVFDVKKAEEAASLFEGVKDFGAVLGKPTKNTRPTVCNIKSFFIEKGQPFLAADPISQKFDYYHFICKGDRFLYHMVRRMVGLSIGVGYGFLTLANIQKLFDEPVPSSWPRYAGRIPSGSGLYLVDVNIDLQQANKTEEVLETTAGVTVNS